MKILFMSNAPWAATGYANQTKLFVPRLQTQLKHELAIFAFYGLEGAIINMPDGADGSIPVYPKAHQPWGNDVLGAHSASFRADIAITLMDSWVLEPKLFPNVRWVPWLPVDHEPMPNIIREKIAQSFQPIVYSKFGQEMAENAGLDVRYVPHGIDTKVFKPGNKIQARDQTHLPQDRFIVGMVAANKGTPSRKSFPQAIEAFATFKRAHPDALLYLHTVKGINNENQGVNLVELIKFVGLNPDRDVLFADQYQLLLGYADPAMAALYQAFDVLLEPSMGEGFGIPILEAQSCGCPVIIGDWTSMPELCFGGWKIAKTDALKFYTPLAAYQYVPQPDAIAECLAEAFYASGSPKWDIAMRQGALQYDADRVTQEHWKPVLDELAARVETNKAILAGAAG